MLQSFISPKGKIMSLNKTVAFIALIALTSLTSCLPEGYNYERGSLPDTPVNLADFNTEYDDYNSTAPSLGRLIPFCFSSNRNSHGNNFDVIYRPMNVNFDKTSGILEVTDEYSNWGIFQADYDVIKNGLNKVNTTGNEFGPYLIHHYNNEISNSDFLLLYATDISGNFEIQYTFNSGNPDFARCWSRERVRSSFLRSYLMGYFPRQPAS